MKRIKICKSKYKVISNPLNSYRFSLPSCFAAAIVALIIGAAIGIGLIVGQVLDGGWKSLRYGIVYILILAGPFLFMGLQQILWIRDVKKIITNGEQVDGKIIKYHKTASNNRTTIYVMFNYHFEQVCEIGVGRKKPEKALASPYCKVFIFDEKIFVKDFELRKKGDPEIEFLERHIKHMSSDYL